MGNSEVQKKMINTEGRSRKISSGGSIFNQKKSLTADLWPDEAFGVLVKILVWEMRAAFFAEGGGSHYTLINCLRVGKIRSRKNQEMTMNSVEMTALSIPLTKKISRNISWSVHFAPDNRIWKKMRQFAVSNKQHI